MSPVDHPTQGPPPTEAAPPTEVRARRLLTVRAVWITPVVIASVLLFLMTLIYVGSVVDPVSHLHGLPVLVVDQDTGGHVETQSVNLGQQVVTALDQAPSVASRLSLKPVSLTEAKGQMDKNAAYAALVIPSGFTTSVLALYQTPTPNAPVSPIPTIQLLTNGRAGSIGVGLATGVTQPAIAEISQHIGQHLASLAGPQSDDNPGAVALRAAPLTFAAVPYRTLPQHSALGLSAFYISLLTIMCGFLGGTLVNSTIDAALGYATNEIGPKWRQRAPAPITRWQTLLAKWAMATAVMPLLTGFMLVVAVGILHMDAPDVIYLWLFASFAAVVVAIGTLVLFAALGSLGQLVAMLVFVYLALASSGGTIPLQALPGILKFAAAFEPLRQVLDGVRSILYFNAQADAGLARGLLLTAAGLVIWLLLGTAVTIWYDRKGLYRLQPEVLAYVNRAARSYTTPEHGDAASGVEPVAQD